MSFINLFHRPHVTLLTIAAIVNICASVAVAPRYRTCDGSFYPGSDPSESICNSGGTDYPCATDSCGEYSLASWQQFTFQDCLFYLNNDKTQPITTNRRDVIHPLEYRVGADGTYVDAQDRDDRIWYRCPFSIDNSFNSRRATCSNCATLT
ncbi:hypothetical protein PTTG_12285 [Puccinia triticina 1-1 BBBD Race 1]|uniref:Secreted protein n=2 Tax=Puccinia triticina TaxID=208348 RepID=A0A180H1C3_PUCT1|nr:uncharacterized protein PtA15_5A670 [Puccinia triticina]OAV98847.1 hypothetical protein PTTG_12285 [Puccinia triticina 1-1 BBBD Race 1]WAQ85096.1 hypothetical protein PtA15_5A670 [Puccinia triticina]WAR58430.1 hypothetical protein PtB15_5B664 [Puccinia triticina]